MDYGILGIDWGLSKIGVAVAHTETRLATGLITLKNDEHLVENLEKIIKEYDVQLAVIGIPVRSNQEAVFSGGEEFGARLEKKFGLKITYHNERYTTKMARVNLIEKGAHSLDQHDDREAARLILQSWLDAQK